MNTPRQVPEVSVQYQAKQHLCDEFLERYALYVIANDEAHLMAFSELGRKMNQAAIPPEMVIELYALARQRTPASCCMTEDQRLLPLMEVIMTYGINYREQIQWQQTHSSAQFYRVLEASGHLILITDKLWHVHYSNPAFNDLFGAAHSRSNLPEHGFLSAMKAQQRVLKQLHAERRWRGKVTAAAKRNQTLALEVTAFTIGLGGRQSSHIVFMAEDVTQRLAMEKRLAQSQRLSSLGELASGITHEFNNVMTIINGFAELIRDEPDAASRNDYVSEILAALDKGQKLNQQILSFAADRETVVAVRPLREIVSKVETFVATAAGSDIALLIGEVPEVMVRLSEQHLSQLLTNLCINARHAIEKQHSAEQGTISIRFNYHRKSSWLEISVSDNGCGMTTAVREQIFEPFYTTKDIGEGTGLGLSLLQKLVLEYEGEIQVRSAPGKGADFNLLLPVVILPPSQQSVPTPSKLLKQWVDTTLPPTESRNE